QQDERFKSQYLGVVDAYYIDEMHIHIFRNPTLSTCLVAAKDPLRLRPWPAFSKRRSESVAMSDPTFRACVQNASLNHRQQTPSFVNYTPLVAALSLKCSAGGSMDL